MQARLERRGHVERRRVAGTRVALEADPNRAVEPGRDLRAELRDRHHRVVLLLQRELRERAVLVRQPAGKELVGADAERVDVGGGARLLAGRLLG